MHITHSVIEQKKMCIQGFKLNKVKKKVTSFVKGFLTEVYFY